MKWAVGKVPNFLALCHTTQTHLFISSSAPSPARINGFQKANYPVYNGCFLKQQFVKHILQVCGALLTSSQTSRTRLTVNKSASSCFYINSTHFYLAAVCSSGRNFHYDCSEMTAGSVCVCACVCGGNDNFNFNHNLVINIIVCVFFPLFVFYLDGIWILALRFLKKEPVM